MPRDLADIIRPARAALVLQELQNGVIGPQSALPALAEAAERVGLVAHAAALAVAARAASAPVIHCTAQNLPGGFGVNSNARLFAGVRRAGGANAPGTTSVEPVAGVGLAPGDHVLPRFHGLSPLTGGPLDSLLRNSGIDTIVLAGVSLNVAIPNVVFDAVNRSYQVVVVTDKAVAGVPDDYGRAVLDNTLSLLATLASTEEVVAVWRQLS